MTDVQRARKNLKRRMKYAEKNKDIVFEFEDIAQYPWESDEDYIERLNEMRG